MPSKNKFEALVSGNSSPNVASSPNQTNNTASNKPAPTTNLTKSKSFSKPSSYSNVNTRFSSRYTPGQSFSRSKSMIQPKTWKPRNEQLNNQRNDGSHTEAEGDNPKSESAMTETSRKIRYPAACIFVASLVNGVPLHELKEELQKMFRDLCGMEPEINVLKDGHNRPYSFTQFDTVEDARYAIRRCHGHTLYKRPLRCEWARVNRSIFISPKVEISEEETKAFIGKFGEIEDFVEAKETDLPNVHEFEPNEWIVKFAQREDGVRAYNDSELNSKWNVTWCQNVDPMLNLEKLENRTISIKNLPEDITEDRINNAFLMFGPIRQISIVKLFASKRVFACVMYEHELNAREATQKMNGAPFEDATLEVEHRLAVISSEGEYSGKQVDPRVPSAPSATTDNKVVYRKPPRYPINRKNLERNAGNSILSPPPHPRSFSANQYYSPKAPQMNDYGMQHSPQFGNMNYYPMYTGGNVGGRNGANGYGASYNFYPPIIAQGGNQGAYRDGGYSYSPEGQDVMSGGLSNSGSELGSASLFSPSDASSASTTSNSGGRYTGGTNNKFFYGNEYGLMPRPGVGVPFMNPYQAMMFNPGFYPSMQQPVGKGGQPMMMGPQNGAAGYMYGAARAGYGEQKDN